MNADAWHPSENPLRSAAPEFGTTARDSMAWMNTVRLMRRKLWLILGLTIAICAAALPVILTIPKTYQSEMRVFASLAPALTLTSQLGGRELHLDLDTELERLVSAAVVEEVIARLNLGSREEFNRDLRPKKLIENITAELRAVVESAIGLAPTTTAPETTAQRIESAFRASLSVGREGQSGVVTIGFVSRDPELAASVPGVLVETWINLGQQRWQAEAEEAIGWLDIRIASERARVESSRAALDRELQRVGLTGGMTPDAASVDLSRIGDRLSELERERLDLAVTRRSMDTLRSDSYFPTLTNPSVFDAMRENLHREERELERVRLIYGTAHDSVKSQSRRVADAQTKLETALAAFDRTLRVRDDAIAHEIDRLHDDALAARAVLVTMQSAAPFLKQKADLLGLREETLNTLEAHRDEISSDAAVWPLALETLSPAKVPLDPNGPSRKVLLLATALGGLVLSATLGVALELRDTTVRSHQQLRDLTGFVPVGLWSRINSQEMSRDILKRRVTAETEALRDMLTMIESACGGGLPRLLTVTAPREEDVSLPVADLIALELAASGYQVNLFTPHATEPRRLYRRSKRVTMQAATHSNLVRHPLSNLLDRPSSEMSATLRALSGNSREANSITIVDAPPLLSQGALRFGRLDGAILVTLRWGWTPRVVMEFAHGLLIRLKAPSVFTLVTDADPKQHRQYGFTDRLSLAPTQSGT
ncbi:MAG: hypothetical protein ACSHX3_15455 [Litorimonas sp.]